MKQRNIFTYISAAAVAAALVPLPVFAAPAESAVDYPLYFDGETSKLYKTFDYVFETGEITYSDPIEVPGAECEGNKLTLTSDFQFYTDYEDGLYLGEGTTLYVPEGESPSVHSAVSGLTMNDDDEIGGTSGIYCLGNNTLDIDGSLDVTAGGGTNISSWGITSDKYETTITGNGSLTVSGGNIVYDDTIETSRGDSCGIYTLGDLNISLAELNAAGGEAYKYSTGIVADYPSTEPRTITVSGGAHVSAKGGVCKGAEESQSIGCAANHVTVKDNSSLTASVSDANMSFGLVIYDTDNYGDGKIELSGGSSLVLTELDTTYGCGVISTDYINKPVIVSMDKDCTFTAESAFNACAPELTGVSAVSDGKAVTFDSEKYGYVDADGNLVKQISFQAPDSADAPEPTDAPEVGGFPFTDVKTADWFYNAVKAAYNEGLISGVTETEFAPKATLTRGMVTTIIGRMGAANASGGSSFKDVGADAYYAPYVAWAAENGIVSGFTDGTFRPDESVTREQTAAILYRYMRYVGADVSVGGDTNILSFTDAGEISEYAFPALQWACGAGIINGYGDGTLAPKASITRAEFAAMVSKIALI